VRRASEVEDRRTPTNQAGRTENPTGSRLIKEKEMILATTKVEDFDRFLEVFGTKGAVKREQHGSKGSTVFRDPSETDRVWALFDWDEQGWKSFVSDPDVPPILKEAGHVGTPQAALLAGTYRA
jgi:hypothetical protein